MAWIGNYPWEQLELFRESDKYGPRMYFTRFEQGVNGKCLWWHIPAKGNV